MNINKVAVIGAGVMGAGISAHFANAGTPVYLLDVVAKDGNPRSSIAEHALALLLKSEPPAFMHKNNARLITPGNIEDHLDWLREVDWVVEAVIENPAVKQALYQKLDSICRADTVISSNTSTLPLKLLTQNLPESFKQRFMITHFFNPPRYMRLLELVATEQTKAEFMQSVTEFCEGRLGKSCVQCNDTPGFIANRIGTFWMQSGLLDAFALDLDVELADRIMTAFGIPKTGIFGLLDLIGLDLLPHVLESFKQLLPKQDALQAIISVPPFVQQMLAEGYTGRKGKGGFYRLQPNALHPLKEVRQLHTGDYQPGNKNLPPGFSSTPDALRALLSGNEPGSRYAWQVISKTLCYAANLIPEIASHIVAVDTAMRLGYNWQYGPFELIDLIGVDWFAARLEAEQRVIPALFAKRQSLYKNIDREPCYADLSGQYQAIPKTKGTLRLADYKISHSAVLENSSASLWDIGDGVACLEFHSKMNTLNKDTLSMVRQSIEWVKNNFSALVIYNDADNFSAGADLTLLVAAIHEQNWQAAEHLIQEGQQSYSALKYAPFPVVGVPAGLALGGGCEILLHCDAIQAHAELYIGLVEVGVGLIPGWGGCKEYLGRWLAFPKRPGGAMPAIAQAFETIGQARVSKSAQEAKEMLFLSSNDGITMHRDRLLADAKAKALALLPHYAPPEPFSLALPGAGAKAALNIAAQHLQLAGKISVYDFEIAQQLASVLSGGECDISAPISETELLNLELQAFINLIKQPGTLARLEHLLKTGKPLRN